jgi:excisionase family DNA binding protein
MKPQKRVLTVLEAAKVLRIGRDMAYDMVKAGEIPSIKLGRIYRVPIAQLDRYLDGSLKKEA